MSKRATHVLTDIKTDEVSLVDKAANKHRFLIVKRDLMKLKPEIKKSVINALAPMLAAIADLTESVQKAEEGDDGADRLPDDVTAAIKKSGEALVELASKLVPAQAETKPADQTEAKPDERTEAEKKADQQLGEQLGKLGTQIDKMLAPPPPAPSPDVARLTDAVAKLTTTVAQQGEHIKKMASTPLPASHGAPAERLTKRGWATGEDAGQDDGDWGDLGAAVKPARR